MSEKDFSIDKKHVLDVMDFNKCDEVLVTSSGHIYLKKAESFCKSECIRTGTEYKTVTREEVSKADKAADPAKDANTPKVEASKSPVKTASAKAPKVEASKEPAKEEGKKASTSETEEAKKEGDSQE